MTDTEITFVIISYDGNDNQFKTRFNYGNSSLVTNEEYSKIDTCARAIINCSTNTYSDTIIEQTKSISVNDELG